MSTLVVAILSLIAMLLASAFFSGSETALIGSRKITLKDLAEKGNPGAALALKLLENPGALLGTILIGNTLVNTGAAVFLTSYLGPLMSAVITTLLLLVFGEIIPKTLASHWPEKIAARVSFAIRFLEIVLKPVLFVIDKATAIVLKPLFGKFTPKRHFHSRDELLLALDQSGDAGELEPGEAQMAREILDLPAIKLREIMIPRAEAAVMYYDWSLERILTEVKTNRFSRYPVFRRGSKKPCGMLHVKDLIFIEEKKTWRAALRKLPTMSAEADAGDLLRDMQLRRYHMASIIDADGGVVGFLTMERILEEIVGEIADEHERVPFPVVNLPDGRFLVRGDLELADIALILNLDMADADPELTLDEYFAAAGNSYAGVSEAAGRGTEPLRLGDALITPKADVYLLEIVQRQYGPEIERAPAVSPDPEVQTAEDDEPEKGEYK